MTGNSRDEAVKLWDNGRFSFLLYSEPDEVVKSWDNGRFWFGVVMVTIPNEETASKSMFYREQDTGLIRHYQNTHLHAYRQASELCLNSFFISTTLLSFEQLIYLDCFIWRRVGWWRDG